MAKITRIKAKDHPEDAESGSRAKKAEKAVPAQSEVKAVKKASKAIKAQNRAKDIDSRLKNVKESEKKPFILIRPFVYFGRYIRDSWFEIRQVRWPSRKATWKLFFAIIIYTLLFVGVIMLLDALFTWIFETVIS